MDERKNTNETKNPRHRFFPKCPVIIDKYLLGVLLLTFVIFLYSSLDSRCESKAYFLDTYSYIGHEPSYQKMLLVEEKNDMSFIDYQNIGYYEGKGLGALVCFDQCGYLTEEYVEKNDWRGIVTGLTRLRFVEANKWYLVFTNTLAKFDPIMSGETLKFGVGCQRVSYEDVNDLKYLKEYEESLRVIQEAAVRVNQVFTQKSLLKLADEDKKKVYVVGVAEVFAMVGSISGRPHINIIGKLKKDSDMLIVRVVLEYVCTTTTWDRSRMNFVEVLFYPDKLTIIHNFIPWKGILVNKWTGHFYGSNVGLIRYNPISIDSKKFIPDYDGIEVLSMTEYGLYDDRLRKID